MIASNIVSISGGSFPSNTVKTKLSESSKSESLTETETRISPVKSKFGVILNNCPSISNVELPSTPPENINSSFSTSSATNTIS